MRKALFIVLVGFLTPGQVLAQSDQCLWGNDELARVIAFNRAIIQASAQSSACVEPSAIKVVETELTGIQFTIVNESKKAVLVRADRGRAELKPGAEAMVYTPNPKVFTVEPDGAGSYQAVEVDLRGLEDPSLPGWRIKIPPEPKPEPKPASELKPKPAPKKPEPKKK